MLLGKRLKVPMFNADVYKCEFDASDGEFVGDVERVFYVTDEY